MVTIITTAKNSPFSLFLLNTPLLATVLFLKYEILCRSECSPNESTTQTAIILLIRREFFKDLILNLYAKDWQKITVNCYIVIENYILC